MKKTGSIKTISILLLVLSSLYVKASGSDTLVVIFDRQHFVQGDSIDIEVYTEPYRNNPTAQTLHLWIDNVKTGQRWKYRYPFLKGRCTISLKISDSIPKGTYAFNFLLQNQFLTVKGKVLNAAKQDTSVNYVARATNRVPVIDGADLQPGGYFKIENLFFTDSVLFSFSPVQSQKKKENKLRVSIETPVDSLFIPGTTETEWITIGIADSISPKLKNSYSLSMSDVNASPLMKEVIVKTKTKKAIDEYNNKYVSGLFGGGESHVFDFLDSDEPLKFPDLFTYLTFKIPGLVEKVNAGNGQPFLTYRNETVDIYVDEYLDTDFSISSISLQDVALVKFFRQSFRLGGGINDNGLGGSLAIYTRRPMERAGNRLSNYTFLIKGYSSLAGEWK